MLIKDDTPRGCWKIGRVCQLTVSQDGQIRSGKVMLPNKKTLNRPLNLLYPIECVQGCDTNDADTNDVDRHDIKNDTNSAEQSVRPKRRAAERAKERMKDWLNS